MNSCFLSPPVVPFKLLVEHSRPRLWLFSDVGDPGHLEAGRSLDVPGFRFRAISAIPRDYGDPTPRFSFITTSLQDQVTLVQPPSLSFFPSSIVQLSKSSDFITTISRERH
jgi:hypothetical protein